jgi:zinc ribbon protein
MLETGALLVLAAVAIGVGFFVAIPFLEARRPAAVSASDQQISSLLAERDRLITSLQELDFDYALGKIPDEAYPAQRGELLQRGANVLRQIDALSPPPAPAASAKPEPNAEDRIEAAVAARRADLAGGQASTAPVDDEIESRVAARRSERKDKSGGFCPNCGKPVLASDRFCPHCGRAIK